MSTHLLRCLALALILSSCASTSRTSEGEPDSKRPLLQNQQPVTSSFRDVDTTLITLNETLPTQPLDLRELPRNQEGAFVLSPGFYESEFKTYCLQPGTPGPSTNDAYFQAPLKGSRKDIIQTILRNSTREQDLDQRNVQLLLWAVVSKTNYSSLSPSVQSAARRLLTPRQVFELQGGMLGAARTAARMLPSGTTTDGIKQIFELGMSSYESVERLAVLSTPSTITRSDFKRDHWTKQADGYYVRYLPSSYQKTRIQVYVPAGVSDSAAQAQNNFALFDPASLVVVPAYSNAQRLGVGGPVIDIVKVIIQTAGKNVPPPRDGNKVKKTGPKKVG